MLLCFSLLHHVDGTVFWQLNHDATELGMYDPMGCFVDGCLNENEVGVFKTHDESGEEYDEIEQWCVVPLSWWKENKDNPNIRQLCQEYLNK